MKLYDIYLKRKVKYDDYVLLIESGVFFEVFDIDAIVLNSLLGYKILKYNNTIRLGFPKKILSRVTLTLESKHVNYLILDKENAIINRKKCKDNQYLNYNKDIKEVSDKNDRIEKIYIKLKSKVNDNNIEKILYKIEELL